MFGFGKKKKNNGITSKNPNSKKYKEQMAAHLDGMSLKCVTERINGVEELVGKSGAIVVRNDELLVYSSMDVLFRCGIYDLNAWELMSLDGAVLTGPDKEHGDAERSIIVHYTYWRQMEK